MKLFAPIVEGLIVYMLHQSAYRNSCKQIVPGSVQGAFIQLPVEVIGRISCTLDGCLWRLDAPQGKPKCLSFIEEGTISTSALIFTVEEVCSLPLFYWIGTIVDYYKEAVACFITLGCGVCSAEFAELLFNLVKWYHRQAAVWRFCQCRVLSEGSLQISPGSDRNLLGLSFVNMFFT